MKIEIYLLCLLFVFDSCGNKFYTGANILGKTYESSRGHLFSGNKFFFGVDSSFTYTGHGPSIFLSKGSLEFDEENGEIILRSKEPDNKFVNPKTVDTLWINLSQKRIKIISRSKLRFEEVMYHLK